MITAADYEKMIRAMHRPYARWEPIPVGETIGRTMQTLAGRVTLNAAIHEALAPVIGERVEEFSLFAAGKRVVVECRTYQDVELMGRMRGKLQAAIDASRGAQGRIWIQLARAS